MHEVKFKPLIQVGSLNKRFHVRHDYRGAPGQIRRKDQLTTDPIKLPGDCPGAAKALAAALKEVQAPVEPPEPAWGERINYTGTPQVCRKTPLPPVKLDESSPFEPTAPRFVDNGDATVSKLGIDPVMWKQCPEGLSGPKCKNGKARLFTEAEAYEYVKQHSFAGHSDWVVPHAYELGQLLNPNCYNPSIDLVLFPNTPPSLFLMDLKATQLVSLGYVDFFGGAGYASVGGEDRYFLRLVRRLPRGLK